jgi:hypothetical protein
MTGGLRDVVVAYGQFNLTLFKQISKNFSSHYDTSGIKYSQQEKMECLKNHFRADGH